MTPWQTFWGIEVSSVPEYPFFEENGKLIQRSDYDRVLHEPAVPLKTAQRAIDAAIRVGATVVRTWPVHWGVAAALAFPECEAAWVVADDWSIGRFSSIGVRIVDNIAFGHRVSVFGQQYARAASYVLVYGVPRVNLALIVEALKLNPEFPYNEKIRRLWTDRLAKQFVGKPLRSSLRAAQKETGVTPASVLATTKTLEIAYEQYVKAPDKSSR